MDLAAFTRILARNIPLQEKLEQMARLTSQALHADICVIQSWGASGTLTLQTSFPKIAGLRTRIVTDNQSVAQWSSTNLTGIYTSMPADMNPVVNQDYSSLLCAPLVMGTEMLGLLSCYFRQQQPQQENAERLNLLSTIANQISVAMYTGLLENKLEQRGQEGEEPETYTFVSLLQNATSANQSDVRRAADRRGYNLKNPHVVVALEVVVAKTIALGKETSSQGPAIQELRTRLLRAFPGTVVVGRGALFIALVDVKRDTDMSRLKKKMVESTNTPTSSFSEIRLGYSDPCVEVSAYPHAFIEAFDALEIGRYLPTPMAATHFDDLGVYRSLYFLARTDTLRDQYQEIVQRIASYDEQKKGGEFLKTLEMYLDCAGNLEQTSKQLSIHRNTLLQRRDRMQEILGGIDLSGQSLWLPLQMAIKVYRIRQQF